MIELFDTHAHLDQPEFDADRAEVVSRRTMPELWK